MSKSAQSQKTSKQDSGTGCLILFIIPLLYLTAIFPFQEFANGCPNGGPKGATPRSIARPSLDCSTYGRTHTVALITGIGTSSYLFYRRNRQGQPLYGNKENSSKAAAPSGWVKVLFAGLIGLLCNLIVGLGFSASRAIGTFIIVAPMSFAGGLFFVFFIVLSMEIVGWMKVTFNKYTGKNATVAQATENYTFEKHIEGKSEKIKDLALSIQKFILELDATIEQSPKKFYIAYKTSENIASMEVQQHSIRVSLKLNTTEINNPPPIYRDVTSLDHFGIGNAEFTISTESDFEMTKPFIEQTYRKVGR